MLAPTEEANEKKKIVWFSQVVGSVCAEAIK
jgi:hypothetical protein